MEKLLFTRACLLNNNKINIILIFNFAFSFSGGVVIYFDRIEVVNILEASSGIILLRIVDSVLIF